MSLINPCDASPRYLEKILEETKDYVIYTTSYGETNKDWKDAAMTEHLDRIVKTRDDWQKAKERMKPAADRLNWKDLKERYPAVRKQNGWAVADIWFGFDITHSHMVGTEAVLMALVEDPEWCIDMFNTELDLNIALLKMAADEGYKFDELRWPDDMGYKLNQFFSVDMYKELLKPVHKRAVDFAHSMGMKANMHSCGDIRPFVPELVDIGLDMLNPLEVKAGVNPPELKEKYGEKLCFLGGLNAILFHHPEQMWEQMREFIPKMKKGGGYMVSTDHSVPDDVTLNDFKEFIRLAKELGRC